MSIHVSSASAFLRGSPEDWPVSRAPELWWGQQSMCPKVRWRWCLGLGDTTDPVPTQHRTSGQKKSQLSASCWGEKSKARFLKSNRSSLSKEIFYKTSMSKTEKSGCIKGRPLNPAHLASFGFPQPQIYWWNSIFPKETDKTTSLL